MLANRSLSQKLLATLATAMIVGQAATTADAAPINYGDFSDIPPGSVMYLDVTESSSSDPVPPGLYGGPSIFVDDLDFDPTGFGATSVGPIPGADITEGQLNFGFMTTPGNGLENITISEGGDFSLTGAGTTVTSVGAGIFIDVDITHVNFVALATPISVVASTSFSADLTTSPGMNQPWSQTLLVDFGPALANAGFDPNIDKVTKGEIVLNNTLTAITEGDPSTIAQIAKKDFKVRPGVGDAVPEPGSLALIAIGAAALLPRRRRS